MADLPEIRVHNGEVLDEVPGVKTEALPSSAEAPVQLQVPKGSVQDVEPEALAAAMARCISAQLDIVPRPTPMEIVNELLRLQTPRRHKVVWTRFDVHQLFARWTNKMEGAQRV